jgi:signal transduction histidine kinase
MRWPRMSLWLKFLLSYIVAVAVGVVTLFVAASAVGPDLFANQMVRMMGSGMNTMMAGTSGLAVAMQPTLDAAFRASLTQSLVIAAAVAALVAVAVSAFVARQIVQPISRMLTATRRIAAGHYAERVPIAPANTGDELGELAASFNEMASSLEQAERRRLELVGNVAHELRTPIATLEGYLEGLLDGVVEPSAPTWAKLHDEAGRLRRLVDDLQELSRAEARQVSLVARPVAPADLVRASVDRLRPSFDEKGLTLQSTVPGDLPDVRADVDRAIQILTNLLTNALRYTPAGGLVTVSAATMDDTVTFRVGDTGVGFETELGDQLFERFFRVDKSRSRALGGSGIGLTIARALVEAMGGRIWAESAGPGKGSSFSFTLPTMR